MFLRNLSLALVFSFGCSEKSTLKNTDQDSPNSIRFIDEYIFPHKGIIDATMIGGFSGIDFDGDSLYYIICDDAVNYGPVRYYTAGINYNDTSFLDVRIRNAVELRQIGDLAFPAIEVAEENYVDPESIRLDTINNLLLWTSEGFRIKKQMNPLLYIHTLDGQEVKKFTFPERYNMMEESIGPRHNAVFEGLTLVPKSNLLWISLESALYQDGAVATYDSAGAPVRFLQMDVSTGQIIKEFGYNLEPIFAKGAAGKFGINGIVEILWFEPEKLLVLERAYVAGAGNKVRLFLAEFGNATNIVEMNSLQNESISVAEKTLLLDFDDLPIGKVDNIEGFTWGKDLPSGEKSLLFISDDNFNESQVSQLILLGLKK